MTKLPKIECSRCVDPGMCCRSFPLNHAFAFGTTMAKLAEWLRENKLAMFRPLRRSHVWHANGTMHEQWYFRCTALRRDGRCGIYAKRPNLCREYEPGSDMMCVHVRGQDGRPMVPQKKRER